MSIDTERYAEQYAGELRDRLRLDGLRSDLEFPSVMASSRRAARRRRAGIGGGVAAALALGVAASPVGLDAPALVADAMRSVRLAHVAGLAGDLSEPLHVAWTAPGFFAGEDRLDETLLVIGGGTVRALAADGTQRWSVPSSDSETCVLAPHGQAGAPREDSADQVVYCRDRGDEAIRLLDPRSGAVLTSLALDAVDGWSADLIGDDVVAVGVDAQGRAVATRWHRDGTVVWNRVGPVLAEPVDGRYTSVRDDALTVISGADVVRFDPATGDLLPATPGPQETLRVQLPGGYSAVQLDAGTSREDLSVATYAPDGSLITTVPGHFQQPSPDDGSVPGLLLLQGASTLRAMDLAAGSVMWEREFVPVMILDGHVIGWSASNELESLDARTGDVIWQRPPAARGAGSLPSNPAVTDGRTILTIEYGDQPSLVAVDVESGALRWSEPWEGGADVALAPSTAGVIVSGSSPVMLLRP